MRNFATTLRLTSALLIALAPFLGLGVSSSAQDVPARTHFQGRLTDASNNPLTGPNSFVFEIFDAPAAGALLWTEAQPAVPVANGVFAVQLGAATPLPSTVFSGSAAYLQVTVNGNVMSPRERLVSVPYSHNSQLLSGREFAAFVSTDAAAQSIAGAKTFTGTVFVPAPTAPGHAASKAYVDAAGGTVLLSSTNTWSGQNSFLNLVSVSSDLVITGVLNRGTPLSLGGPLSVAAGVTAASGTFTASGPAQFSLQTSSGVSVGGTGGVYANFFSGSFYGSGAGLTGLSGTDATKVAKAGDAMTGPLTLSGSTLTVTGDAFSVGGSTLAVINGSVGIGTAAPLDNLEIQGSGASAGLRLASNAASTSAGTEIIRFGTYVGGVYTPTAILGDTSGADSNLKIFALQGNMNLGANTGGSASTRMIINTSGGVTIGGTDQALAAHLLYIDGLSKFVVDTAGNVGVGTASPATRLDVSGGGMILRSSMTLTGVAAPAASAAGQGALYFDSAQNKFLVSENGGAYQPLGNAGTYVARTGDTMTGQLTNTSTVTVLGNAFSVGGSTLAVTGGKVGIGTAGPTEALHVRGNAPSLKLEHTGGADVTLHTSDGSGLAGIHITEGTNKLSIQDAGDTIMARASGSVGIRTVDPAQALDVNGNAQFGAGAAKSTFTAAGALSLASGAALTLAGPAGDFTGASSVTASGFFGDGSGLTNLSASDASRVAKAGDTMTGQLTNTSTVTVQGNAFSVGGSTLVVTGGSVGVGTTSPGNARLAVRGAVDFVNQYPQLQVGDSATTMNINMGTGDDGGAKYGFIQSTESGVSNDRTLVLQKYGGNVGVGTTSPGAKLDVEGAAQFGSGAAKSTFTAAGGLTFASGFAPAAAQDAATKGYVDGQATAASGWTQGSGLVRVTNPSNSVVVQSTLTVQGNAFSVGGSTLVVTGGNVGIGTPSPGRLLSLFANAGVPTLRVQGAGGSGGNNAVEFFDSNASKFNWLVGSQWSVDGGFEITPSAAAGGTTYSTPALVLKANGNVGVGTTAPTSKLEVAGDIRTSGGGDLILNPAVSGATMYLYNDFGELNVTSGTPSQRLFTVKSDGNVGVGTATPAQKLDVRGGLMAYGVSVSTDNGSRNALWLAMPDDFNHALYNDFSNIDGEGGWDGAKWNVFSGLNVRVGTSKTSALYIGSSGGVGIGTTAPANRLDIAGGGMILRSSMTLAGVAAPAASAAGQGALYFDSAQNKFLVSENGGAYQPLGNAGTYVARTGDAMTGPLTMLSGSTVTVTGNAFSVGGTTLVVTNGNIGVGTANPGARLEVNGAIKMADVSLRVDTGDNDRLVFQPATPNTSANIGVTRNGASGSSGLEVIGTDYIADRINYEMFRILANEGVVPPRYQLVSAAGGTGVQRDITVGFGANESVRFAANGNVGIGTTTPTERLQFDDVASGSDVRIARKAAAAHAAGNVPSSLRLSISDGGESGVFVMNQRNLANTFNDQYIRFDTHEGGVSVGERVRIAPNGNVGVGTTSPGAKLDVAGHQLFSVAGASITFNAGGPTIGVPTGNTLAFGTSGIERMRIDNVGNLGVATDAPGHQFQFGTHFNGTVANAKMFINSGGYNAWNGKIAVSPDGNAAVASVISSYHDNTLNIQKLGLGTIGYSGVERTMVLQNGNVGILTETPANPLQVSLPSGTGTPYVAVNQTADNPYLELQRWTGSGSNYEGVRIKDVVGSGGILAFETVQNGGAPIGSQTFTERMRIQGGNVGIGTSTPGSRLEAAVDDAVSASTVTVLSITHATTGSPAPGIGARLNFKAERSDGNLSTPAFIAGLFTDVTAGSEDGDLVFGTIRNSAGSGDERMRITSDGNVGIGTTSPGAKLHVAGDIIGKAQVLRARMSANFSKGANSWEKIPFDQTLFNTLSGTFDTVNNRFTASRAGYYQVSVSGYSSTASTAHDRYALGVRKNGVLDYFCGGNYSDVDTPLSGCPGIVYLNGSTDYVEAFGYSAIAATWNGTGTTGHEMFWFISYAGE